ncbi:hypothetical protein GGR52DRAFT_43746 [Hypoxylon sp. FL1284]|nr:hypothetical protein GGR52DRAFT_43746 [Hypoxylon sp. FL1284]
MDRPRRALRSNPTRAAKVKKPVRATRSTAAYFTSSSTSASPSPSSSSSRPSSSSTNDDIDFGLDGDYREYSTTTRSRTQQNQPTRKRKNTSFQAPASPKKHPRRTRQSVQESSYQTVARRTRTSTTATPTAAAPTTRTHYPPWSTTPYLVLRCVFDHVAAPIRDPSSRREDVFDAVDSLMSAARACKAFTEPALANLYKCPPFFHQWRYTKQAAVSLSQFFGTLSLPSGATFINYRPKVEVLRFDVRATLVHNSNANYLSLPDAVRSLPRLSDLEFYHPSDEPPYRKLDEHVRFKCSADDLIQTLEPQADEEQPNPQPTELKSWRWNSRLTSESLSLDKLEHFHQNPSFVTLRKVAFVNYQLPSWGLAPRLRDTEEMQLANTSKIAQLAACISALPCLEHLILESCTLVNGSLLHQLPKTLKHLELINCWEVTADDLYEFLLTHGSHLQTLTINHCQSLSLAFLPVLGPGCPNLQRLYMDLSYFRHHEHYADNKPEYETLLAEDQVPTWPSSIQSIEILHMRKWGRRAAETFFGSLVQSAPNLPQLRHLAFRVALDIGWRQRRELREFWVEKMTKIFKRKSKPPRNITAVHDMSSDVQQKPEQSRPTNSTTQAPPKRRSTRLADLSPTQASSDGEAACVSKRGIARASAISRELKLLKGSGMLLKERDADDEESEDELAADHSDQNYSSRSLRKIPKQSRGDEFIHGLCEVVDIQVDNHRPTERQFDMDDFVDSADETDPDWDGGDVDVFD